MLPPLFSTPREQAFSEIRLRLRARRIKRLDYHVSLSVYCVQRSWDIQALAVITKVLGDQNVASYLQGVGANAERGRGGECAPELLASQLSEGPMQGLYRPLLWHLARRHKDGHGVGWSAGCGASLKFPVNKLVVYLYSDLTMVSYEMIIWWES